MNFFSDIFNIILYRPLLNILVLFYLWIPGHDFGIAVIVLTILIKLIFYPLHNQAIRSQKALAELQPKLKEIQKKYKEDKEKEVQATLELYKKEKINPFSGCLPLLIQLPVLIALYHVFWKGFQAIPENYLYGFVPNPGAINPSFFGLINLSKPNIPLAVLAGASQFIQSKMMFPAGQKTKEQKTPQFGDIMQKQMLYILPLVTVLILWSLPSAIGLFWLTTTIFSIIQQYFVFKKYPGTI